MEKNVKEIVISANGIDIISTTNGVNNVTQINLEPHENEVKDLLEKYNLSDLKFYPVDMNIVRGLSESHEQLVDYLETTRRLSNSKQKVEVPDSIPQILYDLKELKEGFKQIPDEDLRKFKQIQVYNQAKQTQSIFKGTKKVDVRIGPLDRGYFAVQSLLQNRNRGTQIKALNSGIVQDTRNLRRELYNPELTKATNEVALKHATENEKEDTLKTNNEQEMIR